ncbi:hypothetical protein FSS13T_24370 [Flavobacterium saliperosum S13]|uniref:Lipoprotein n=2 Tax=Flavobacterium saliperosum TaxID=329186 RepID=A0A1G4W758_9FLAO|nr:hypothetical protein [Flavobacterium saliperosum]ESU22986.1 hypothetical protein FSS13T_24370 [Flavobacterium saliperosum S13]SCX17818.1 hypothetical protein SAMN02927925_02588 [Flavobacterium saliperosum]
MKKIYLGCVCILLFSGCAGVQNTETEINQKLDAKSDKEMVLVKVINDSRCPEGVQCVWAGEVVIAVAVYNHKKLTEEAEFTLNKNTMEEVKVWFEKHLPHQKTALKDIQVLPYPKEGVEQLPEAYYIKLVY